MADLPTAGCAGRRERDVVQVAEVADDAEASGRVGRVDRVHGAAWQPADLGPADVGELQARAPRRCRVLQQRQRPVAVRPLAGPAGRGALPPAER